MPNVNTLLDDHVVLKYEMVDRIFLNGYVPKLQESDQLSWFLSQHRGQDIPRYELLGKMTRDFLAAIDKYIEQRQIPLVHFERGQRKEAIAAPYFAQAARTQRSGVVMIGIAQEKANVFRAPAKGQRERGRFGAHRNSAFVKHVYFYIWDKDFGPGFIKFCTYAPFSVRVCLNGHQWLLQRLRQSGHYVEPLDNAIADVDDVRALQRLCRRFGPQHIQRFFDRWLSFLPNPFSSHDRRAGYTYQLSILQLEMARTEVFDRPLHGRQFFEEVIKDHLDLGRPDQIQLIFGAKRTPTRFNQPPRTRVFSENVHPSLHVSFKHTGLKQYWKLNRALRTETTFHDSRDFGVGKKLDNLPKLIEIGRQINRRLLEMERLSHRATPAATQFEALVMPTGPPGQRAPGLRFGDPRTVALLASLSQFTWVFSGFRARELRPVVELHLASDYSMNQMAYDLRRLVRKGLLQRLPRSHRYQLTKDGRRWALLCTKIYSSVFCPTIARLHPHHPPSQLGNAFRTFETALDAHLEHSPRAA